MAVGAVSGRTNGAGRAKPDATPAALVDDERTRRFHEAASPHLNDVYTLACYLMRNLDDAEDFRSAISGVYVISTATAAQP
jgi:hypothetical protein